jgi:transporter family-2 protein
VSPTGLAAVLAFAAGLGGAVQIAVLGRLGERVGSLEALTTTAVVGVLFALVVLLVAKRSLAGVGEAITGPKWLLLGGVIGACIVLAVTIAGPRVGVVATTALLIAGQLGLAAILDRFGWLGVDRAPLSWSRAAGIVLLLAGALLTLRR